jgi:hypothetical protein
MEQASDVDVPRGGRDSARRARLADVLTGLAAVLAVLALVLSYAGRSILSSEAFADRAVATLNDQSVRDDVADHLTNAIVTSGNGDLAAVRPLVRAIAGGVVGSGAFAGLFRRAVIELHASLVAGHGSALLLTVADAGVLMQGALERLAPNAAAAVGADRLAKLGSVQPGSTVLAVIRFARHAYAVAWVLAVGAVVLALLALWLSGDRRRTTRRLGFGLAFGGLATAALYLVGGAIAGRLAVPGRGSAVVAIWRAFAHGLLVQALCLAAAGAIVAAVAMAGEREAPGAGAGLTPAARAARSLLVVAAGVVILFEPAAAVTVAAYGAGLIIVFYGARSLVEVAVSTGRPGASSGRGVAWKRHLRRLAGPVLALAAVAGAAAVITTGGGDEAAAVTPAACNGAAALCERPLNDVSFASTHNSMASVTIPSWLFGQQDGTIKDQLDYGIRGLLIDTYYGYAVKGGVRTDLASLPKRELAVKEIGAPAVDAAERIRSRMGDQNLGPRQIFLCHGFCEIGAVSLSSALADLRTFLVSNPGAVVVVINQDEGVTPRDIERAFDQAGLIDLVYRGPLGPFPTLREMIDSGQRLVVMAENDAGTIPWYHLAYGQALQETPFTFKTASALTDPPQLAPSCRANRGPASAPLFLLNNWVDTTPVPRASLAALVNAHAALLRRAQECRRIRHRLPNLVAVDFYRRGDVLGVVRALNSGG